MAKHYHRLHTTCQAQAQKDLRTIAFAHAFSSSGITLVLKGIQSSNPSSSNNYVSETTRSKSVEESREYNINITFRNYANKYIRGTSSHYNTIARRLKKPYKTCLKANKSKFLKKMPIVWETKGHKWWMMTVPWLYRQQINQGQEKIEATLKPSKEINEIKEVDPILTAKSVYFTLQSGRLELFQNGHPCMCEQIVVAKHAPPTMKQMVRIKPSPKFYYILVC